MGKIVELVDHRLVPGHQYKHIIYRTRPVLKEDGTKEKKLHAVEIFLNNQQQMNSYTTEAVKELILAFQAAGCDRYAVAVIFSAEGNKAFCTGGNTKEYAEYYTKHPLEYAQYMSLFNAMVTGILLCQIPVICRVNGMRIAGGQEIGMACDFHISGQHALFGQAGPRHGSAPVGGSTDFLSLYVGIQRAMNSGVLCNMWTADEAKQIDLIDEVAEVYLVDGKYVRYPLIAEDGSLITGKTGKEIYKDIKGKLEKGETEINLTQLDKQVDAMVTKLANLFPMCVSHTVDSFRQLKLVRFIQNSLANRNWLALNMNWEAIPGFCAFEAGRKSRIQVVDFIKYREMLAEGYPMDEIIPDIYDWTATA